MTTTRKKRRRVPRGVNPIMWRGHLKALDEKRKFDQGELSELDHFVAQGGAAEPDQISDEKARKKGAAKTPMLPAEKPSKAKPRPALWPDEKGLLTLPGDPAGKRAGATAKPPAGDRERPKLPKPAVKHESRQDADWRALKQLDITNFNFHSERFFVEWLTKRLQAEDFECLAVSWVLGNAAYELDISTETVKRYVAKHTADRAEFYVFDGFIALRERK